MPTNKVGPGGVGQQATGEGSAGTASAGAGGNASDPGFMGELHEEGATAGDGDGDDIELTTKEKLWALFDDPTSGRPAQFIAIFIMTLIAISCITFCLETLPELADTDQCTWDGIELFCIIFFTIEYVVRVYSTPNKIKFFKGLLNFIDFIAIVPFYIEALSDTPPCDAPKSEQQEGGSGAVFRVVRLVRVFRVFKISRYLSWVRIFGAAMANSAQPLGMLGFIMMIACVFFSSAIYYAEKGNLNPDDGQYYRQIGNEKYGELSPFQSIPMSFWWCIVTMTTVGYGDAYPITFPGKIIACITSLLGILVLAIPITVISTNFSIEYENLKKKKEVVRARMLLLKNHFKEKKGGLEAMNDEIEDLVKRSSSDLLREMALLVEQSKKELVVELQELVKMAYDNKQKELRSQAAARRASGGTQIEDEDA